MVTTKTTPIAARIQAEPGWRVVLLKANEESGTTAIEVHVLVDWALEAPSITPPEPNKLVLMQLFGSMFDALPFPNPSPLLWPMLSGERIPRHLLHRIVPPCETTTEDLLAEAKAWIEAIVAANPEKVSGVSP